MGRVLYSWNNETTLRHSFVQSFSDGSLGDCFSRMYLFFRDSGRCPDMARHVCM